MNGEMSHVSIWYEGNYVKVNRGHEIKKRSYEVKRGIIIKFSSEARNRLRREIAKTDRRAQAVFATWTYPAVFPDENTVKIHLNKFFTRLRKDFPDISGFWKLEYQKRHAPHVHGLLFGVGSITLFRSYCSRVWYEVVGSGDIKHFMAGFSASHVLNRKGVMLYASKYICKSEIQGDHPGRFWGIINKRGVPYSDTETTVLKVSEANQLLRYFRRGMRLKHSYYFALGYICNADWWYKRLQDVLVGYHENKTEEGVRVSMGYI